MDAVEAAEAAERARGDAQGLAGFLARGVNAGGAFNAHARYFLGEPLDIAVAAIGRSTRMTGTAVR